MHQDPMVRHVYTHYIWLSKIIHEIWHGHSLSQRRKTELAVGMGVAGKTGRGGRGEGGWAKFEKGGLANIVRSL